MPPPVSPEQAEGLESNASGAAPASSELTEEVEDPPAGYDSVPELSETAAADPERIVPAAAKKAPSISIEQAAQRIGPKVLGVLQEKFNGSLIEVRAPDNKDQFFP